MNVSPKKIAVVGAGFAGLSTATVLSNLGYNVSIYEKNSSTGGRARQFTEAGFTFDMGPSWYWMPDVIEQYFNRFDATTSDFFELEKLDPGFRVFYGKDDYLDIPDSTEKLRELFESIEPGSAAKLDLFLQESKVKYDTGVNDLVYKPSTSFMEFLSPMLAYKMIRMKALQPFYKYIRQYFSDPKLVTLMEFPILFLGGTAKSTPSLYSLMNYACFELGTWYPMGGFHKLAQAMTDLAQQKGVDIRLSQSISRVSIKGHKINAFYTQKNTKPIACDAMVNSGDYHHFEQHLLDEPYRTYSPEYWKSRVLSPSSLIFYLGVDKKIDNLIHHNLFFDEDFTAHAKEIYENPSWPSKPLFYVCCPSKTDPTVAPEGKENLFILMPLAVGIEDNPDIREQYYDLIMQRLEHITGNSIKEHVVYKKSYCLKDFKEDYHSYKGNAYGLANTTFQTAFMKPRMNSKKISNLVYCGQLTVPGPGVPPSIISGQVAAKEINKYLSF